MRDKENQSLTWPTFASSCGSANHKRPRWSFHAVVKWRKITIIILKQILHVLKTGIRSILFKIYFQHSTIYLRIYYDFLSYLISVGHHSTVTFVPMLNKHFLNAKYKPFSLDQICVVWDQHQRIWKVKDLFSNIFNHCNKPKKTTNI